MLNPLSRVPCVGRLLFSDPETDGDLRIEREKEFIQEFDSLTTENRRFLSNFLEENDWRNCALGARSPPSSRAADADILLDTLKGLVRLNKHRNRLVSQRERRCCF